MKRFSLPHVLGWLAMCCLQVAVAVLNALTDWTNSARVKLWLTIWPRAYVDDFDPAPLAVDMGRTGRVSTWAGGMVKLSLLRATIRDENGEHGCPIDETPHYAWIRGLVGGVDLEQKREEYEDHIRAFETGIDIGQRTREIRRLVASVSESLRSDPDSVCIVVTHARFSLRQGISFFIMDGVHRACVARACGASSIRVRFMPLGWSPREWEATVSHS